MALMPASTSGAGTGTGTGTQSTGLASVLGVNDDQLAQLQRALSAAGSSIAGTAGGNQAGFMRAGPSPQLAQGQPNNLLNTILQMRMNQASAIGSPYQTGVISPAVSLLR
jgi:hypothetical protein